MLPEDSAWCCLLPVTSYCTSLKKKPWLENEQVRLVLAVSFAVAVLLLALRRKPWLKKINRGFLPSKSPQVVRNPDGDSKAVPPNDKRSKPKNHRKSSDQKKRTEKGVCRRNPAKPSSGWLSHGNRTLDSPSPTSSADSETRKDMTPPLSSASDKVVTVNLNESHGHLPPVPSESSNGAVKTTILTSSKHKRRKTCL